MLPTLLAELRSAFSERRARFHIDRSTQMVDAVTRGTIDLAVIIGFPGEVPGRQVGSLDLACFDKYEIASPALRSRIARAAEKALVAVSSSRSLREVHSAAL